jgi:hypothetical protein
MSLPDDVDRYEEQFSDIDKKTIQIWQLAELSAIRQQLERMNDIEPQSESETYTCKSCQAEIPEGELQDHAENTHNAPPNSDPLSLGLFE